MLFHNIQKNKGFTLLELIVVIAILVILSGVIIGAFVIFNTTEGVNKDTELVLETLRLARNQTLASKNEMQYGVHFSATNITLFSGATYNPSTSGNEIFALHAGDSLSVNLNSGGDDVVFDRLTGATSESGTITITSSNSATSKNVTIYSTGLIQGPSL